MNHLVICLLALVPALSGCMAPGGGLDLRETARQVQLARADLHDIGSVLAPEVQEKLVQLDQALALVAGALETAAAGGSVDNLPELLQAAVSVADSVLAEVAPDSEIRPYVVAAKVLLRRLPLPSA